MGYQVILDVIGSSVIGGLLLLTVLNFNMQNIETKRTMQTEMVAITDIGTAIEIISEDFSKIGYCQQRNVIKLPVITTASKNEISFKTDVINNVTGLGNGVEDIVSYKITGPNNSSPEPGDNLLQRSINGGPWQIVYANATQFKLKYYRYNKNNYNDSLSTPVSAANLEYIRRVTLDIKGISTNTGSSFADPGKLITSEVSNSMSFEIR